MPREFRGDALFARAGVFNIQDISREREGEGEHGEGVAMLPAMRTKSKRFESAINPYLYTVDPFIANRLSRSHRRR